jgi:sterol desaturase/sphingolipid hydroxylase (fatty acid hydroxylase superfamily)
MERLSGLIVGFAVFATLFLVLERLFPGIRGQRLLRKGYRTDLMYWLFTGTVTYYVTRAAILLALVPAFLILGTGGTFREFLVGYGPLSRQPLWLQAIEMLVLADFCAYWAHRAFHSKRLWPFHAIHHCSTEVDWLSSARLHPVNDTINKFAVSLPLIALGFSPVALAGIVPLLTFHAIMLHANLNWDFGPLRDAVSSPVFHRWHHTKETEALDKNFGGLFPVWDILFGTYHMPRGKTPTIFGTDDPVPETLGAQLTYPFRRSRARAAERVS